MSAPKNPVVIGRLWTDKNELFRCTRTGVYSETKPLIEGHALLLQQALVFKPTKKYAPHPKNDAPAAAPASP